MPFMSSFSGSFGVGRRSNSIKFGLTKPHRIIAHYSPGNSSSYGGSGATLVDLTNNNYDANIVGSPPFNTDNFLIESGDYISTPSLDADINSSSENHTLEIWCYPTGDGVVAQYCGQVTPNTGYHHSAIEIVSGQVEFGLLSISSLVSSGPTGSINLNTWNQIVLTYDGSYIRGFVNGQRVTKTSVSWTSPADGSLPLHMVFGASATTNQGDGTDFDGNLGIIRIYDRKLSRSSILRNYKHDLETHSAIVITDTPDGFDDPVVSGEMATSTLLGGVDDSVAALTAKLKPNHRFIVPASWIESNVLPNLSSDQSKVFFGVPKDSANWSDVALSDDFWAVFRIERDSSTQHNSYLNITGSSPDYDEATVSSLSSAFYDYAIEWDGSNLHVIATTSNDISTQTGVSDGGSFTRVATYSNFASEQSKVNDELTLVIAVDDGGKVELSDTGLSQIRIPWNTSTTVLCGESSSGNGNYGFVNESTFDESGQHAPSGLSYSGISSLNAGETYKFIYDPSMESSDYIEFRLAEDATTVYTQGITTFDGTNSGDPNADQNYKGIIFTVPADVPPLRLYHYNSHGSGSYDNGRYIDMIGSSVTYAVAPVSTSQDEGTALQFNVTTTDVPDGKTIYWTANHSSTSDADFVEKLFSVTAGSTTISNNSASFDVTSVADSLTEGSETYFVEVRIGIGQTIGLIVATSSTVTVNDTSQNAWDPSTDITTAAWIDASDSSNYTRSGTSLLSVTDKAGTYTMSVGGNPVTNSSTQNGLNIFDFDGNGDYLQSTTYSTQASSGNHWAIGVFRYENVDSNKDTIWSYETNGSPKRDYAMSSGNSSSWTGELDLDGLSSNRISSSIGNAEVWNLKSLTKNQYHIVACWFNKTGNQIGVRIDGSNAFTPVNDYDNSLQTNQELRLMRNRSSQSLDGKLSEFFAVAGIPGTSGTDLTHLIKAEGYLAHKWGLAGSLPSSHAYKNSAP